MTDTNTKQKKGSKLSRILDMIGIIWMILLLPILIIEGTLMFKSIVYPDRLPDFMGYIPLVVETNSMSPTFDGLDVLIIHTPEDPSALQEGEIISYMSGQRSIVTHRIIEVLDDPTGTVMFTTQGDANNTADNVKVLPSMVLGTYVTRFKQAGPFFLFMQTPLGILLCVVLPMILLFLIFYIMDTVRMKAMEKKYQAALEEEKRKPKEVSSGMSIESNIDESAAETL